MRHEEIKLTKDERETFRHIQVITDLSTEGFHMRMWNGVISHMPTKTIILT